MGMGKHPRGSGNKRQVFRLAFFLLLTIFFCCTLKDSHTPTVVNKRAIVECLGKRIVVGRMVGGVLGGKDLLNIPFHCGWLAAP